LIWFTEADAVNHDLMELQSHFSFGENWEEYARKIDERRIKEAEKSLVRLVGRESIQGRTFIDIGSGSGLFSLAALRLGCKRLLAVDIDPKCVEITRALLVSRASGGQWECRSASVFDLIPSNVGTFDVVYSWGVLHHTGAMHRALRSAASLVAPGGLIAIALYGKTPFCRMWRVEKRFYSQASRPVQAVLRKIYLAFFQMRLAMRGETISEHRRTYYQQRGMDMDHDCHDWLGGYPYESIEPREALKYVCGFGFEPVRFFVSPCIGLFGNGCDEYCFTKVQPNNSAVVSIEAISSKRGPMGRKKTLMEVE
jgi:2-polyprenyl-6-hydroxyphenyl methylase/3-demethylubiquinone-9 3-methyltransferase